MWKVGNYNLELGDWRAARRLVFWVLCVLLSCGILMVLKNCWCINQKEVAVSAFGYLHHQTEKFQNWHLLSFSSSWEFLLLSLGTAGRVLYFFSSYLKWSGWCFYLVKCRNKPNAISKCYTSLTIPGTRNQHSLAGAETSGPHCQNCLNQELKLMKKGMQSMEPERRIPTSTLP